MEGDFENINLQAFVPDLEAQQRSLDAYLARQERMSFNDWHERTGGDVAEFGRYIVNLPKIETIQPEGHIVRGEE